GPRPQRQAMTFSFNGQFDPSNADTVAGFKYSYDFDNDGVFDLVDSTSATATHVFPHEGTFLVVGRIKDKDGGFTDYTSKATVSNATLVTGADAGGGPHVIVRDALSGAVEFSYYAFNPAFSGGVRVANGDVNGD